ncbi:hypothetical protein MTO96_027604 [Rhipicephalus appendiculatus]
MNPHTAHPQSLIFDDGGCWQRRRGRIVYLLVPRGRRKREAVSVLDWVAVFSASSVHPSRVIGRRILFARLQRAHAPRRDDPWPPRPRQEACHGLGRVASAHEPAGDRFRLVVLKPAWARPTSRSPHPPSHPTNFERQQHTGVRNLIGWIQRHFAALVLREPTIPEGLLPLNDTYTAVETLLTVTTGTTLLVLLSCMLAALVPGMGLLVLCCRCACHLCGGGSGPETKEDIGRRNTCGCCFSICNMPLMMLLVFAIACYNHAYATVSSIQDEVTFLDKNAPNIFWQPVVDTSVLVNTNSDEFKLAVNARIDGLDLAEPIAGRLIDAMEQLKGNMSDLWDPYIKTASAQLEQVETHCHGCVPEEHKERMDAFDGVLVR